MSETYCGACGDHAPTILGRCASCWGDRPLETALADMALLAREAEEARDADEEIARLTRELEEARARERAVRDEAPKVEGDSSRIGLVGWQARPEVYGVTPYYSDDAVTIYHGDARDVLADLGPAGVDLLLTDPPYGMGYVSGRRANAANVSADGVRQGMRITRQVIAETVPHLATDAHLLVFCHWQSWPDFYDALAPYASVKNALIWWKARGGLGDVAVEYAPDYEMILYATRGRREIFAAGAQGARKRVGAVLAGYPPVGGDRSHPTEKPVGLMRDLVERHTPADGVVLDPFMGTGATIVAARSIGRRAIGIELEERYCEIAAERLSQGVLDLEAG